MQAITYAPNDNRLKFPQHNETLSSFSSATTVCGIASIAVVSAAAGALGAWCVALPVATGAAVGALGCVIAMVSSLAINKFFNANDPDSFAYRFDHLVGVTAILMTSRLTFDAYTTSTLVSITPGIFAAFAISAVGLITIGLLHFSGE